MTVDSRLLRVMPVVVCYLWVATVWVTQMVSQWKGPIPFVTAAVVVCNLSCCDKELVLFVTVQIYGRLLEHYWNFAETCSSRTWDIKASVCICADSTRSLISLLCSFVYIFMLTTAIRFWVLSCGDGLLVMTIYFLSERCVWGYVFFAMFLPVSLLTSWPAHLQDTLPQLLSLASWDTHGVYDDAEWREDSEVYVGCYFALAVQNDRT
jgi:hypothetical protein